MRKATAILIFSAAVGGAGSCMNKAPAPAWKAPWEVAAKEPAKALAKEPAKALAKEPASKPASRPAKHPAAASVMAYVNGQSVPMARLNDVLVRAYGMPIAQQIVAMELARQAVAKKGLSITEKDVDEDHKRTLEQMFSKLDAGGSHEQFLDRFLAQKNMSRGLWRVIMERNALLRKLAPTDIKIPEAEIREQFGIVYDRKVVVRHIQTATLEEARNIKKLASVGGDFAQLAVRHSTHESGKSGGLLPPIGKSTVQISPALRDVALSMTKIGEISDAVQTGTAYHILKLERTIEPKNVKYADVKDKLAESLKEQNIRIFQNRMLQQLIAEAKVRYVNQILNSQDDKAKKAEQAAREEARKATPPPQGSKP